ncbi:hypothetical protein [Belnapia rosea]|uniref:hypothetical protein n=1 Tax=Belnapia rosea TaxID=938405 RepID=UPI0008903C45|nr:hypothetical protein [Belnapia rosea]SDB11204.1 hypothetical protein SAMN02927895_00324 [Belnapia rosea]
MALIPGRVRLVAALLAVAAGAARAEEVPPCPAGAPEIRMTVTDPEPVISRALGIDALHGETGLPRSPLLHHLALTTSRVEWRSEIDTRYRSGTGGVCARPARVALALVQNEHLVRIAGEIPRGGCLWREVLAHERRHVAVNRRTLRAAAAQARAAATGWAVRAEGRGATLDEAMAGLQEGLRHAIEPALAAMRDAREQAHARIDSQAEYERLGEVCPADQRRLREVFRAAVR